MKFDGLRRVEHWAGPKEAIRLDERGGLGREAGQN
jgi:hypothetical protein